MLAARNQDQENLIHGHQQVAASKPLNQSTRNALPKTPGNKFPKTPLKVPIHDENAPMGFGGGKSVMNTKGKGPENMMLGGKSDKNAFITPVGPRNRAPLGMKTTNAKTKAFQTPAAQELDKTQIRPTSTRRMKQRTPSADVTKLFIHGDDAGPLEERDVEYAPPKPKDLPYESEDFPGDLNYDMLRGANLTRGFQTQYFDKVGKDGKTRREREMEVSKERAMKEADAMILKSLKEDSWAISDVPETWESEPQKKKVDGPKQPVPVYKAPPTLIARKAASILNAPPKPQVVRKASIPVKSRAPLSLVRAKKPMASEPTNPSSMRHTSAVVTSRSTIGYSKGRSTSGALNKDIFMAPAPAAKPVVSSTSTVGSTMTPAKFARQTEASQPKRLEILSLFDTDDEEDLEPGLRGALPDCMREDADENEEEFSFKL